MCVGFIGVTIITIPNTITIAITIAVTTITIVTIIRGS
jgi:hypothetical protein